MTNKITSIEEVKRQNEYDGDWSIVCMNACDFALELIIGPFESSEEAVEFALADSRCEKDWQWTVISHEFPHAETVKKITPDPRDTGLVGPEEGTESTPFENDNPAKEG